MALTSDNTWYHHMAYSSYMGQYPDAMPYGHTQPPAETHYVTQPSATSHPGQIPPMTFPCQQSYPAMPYGHTEMMQNYGSVYNQPQVYTNNSVYACPELYNTQTMPQYPSDVISGILLDEPSYRSPLDVCATVPTPAVSGKKRKNSHKLKHTCGLCYMKFSTRSEYSQHVRSHHGEKKTHSCELCGKEFRTRSALATHRRVHTGERPFKCTLCEKSFNDHSSHIKHQRVHSGEKPYTCTHCGKGFTQSGNWKRHVKAVHKSVN